MSEEKNIFLEATAQSLGDMLHRVINNTFIVEYGIIKNIPAEGVVTVEMSVAEKANDIVITDCVLASFASSSVTVRIKPNIDDKVMVLFPRKFHSNMFQKGKNEPIIAEATTGYNVLTGIAILLNQYQEATHKNFIDISDGNLTMKLAYDKDNEKNLVNLTTDKDGNIEINNGKSKVVVNSDGYLSYTNTDSEDNKSKIVFDSNGVTIQDKNGCTITSSKTSIKINNKLEIKK